MLFLQLSNPLPSRIDGVEYEELSRYALYNALQYRMREDVYPVAGFDATSLDAVLLPAGVG